MKKVKVVKQRNPFVAPIMFRKSGVHQKTNKAKRRLMKMDLKERVGVASD